MDINNLEKIICNCGQDITNSPILAYGDGVLTKCESCGHIAGVKVFHDGRLYPTGCKLVGKDGIIYRCVNGQIVCYEK